jgi:hypothetical protein
MLGRYIFMKLVSKIRCELKLQLQLQLQLQLIHSFLVFPGASRVWLLFVLLTVSCPVYIWLVELRSHRLATNCIGPVLTSTFLDSISDVLIEDVCSDCTGLCVALFELLLAYTLQLPYKKPQLGVTPY